MTYRSSRFEGLTNRSPLLAQILEQMQRTSMYQPQSWGALAAGLGTTYLQQKTLQNELRKEQEQQNAQSQALAQALSKYQQQSQGGPVNIPLNTVDGGTQNLQQNYMADPQGARQNLMGSLIQNQNPMAQGLAGQLMSQALAPPAPPEKVDVGDQILFMRDGQILGALPKGATPDAQMRESGENARQDKSLAASREQFNVGQRNEFARLQMRLAADKENAAVTNTREKNRDVSALRSEYEKLPEVQNYKNIVPMVQSLKSAPDTPAGDLDYTYGIAKIMDPNSAVREGEFGLILDSRSPLAKILGTTRVNFGASRLTPAVRQQLQALADNRAKQLETAYDTTRNQYALLAGKMGADTQDVVGEHFGDAFNQKPSGATQSAGSAEYDYVPGQGLVKRGSR